MKFYLIYSNQFALGNKPIGIASLAATLKQNGHSFRLMDCTQFDLRHSDNDSNKIGEISLQFKPPSNPERLPQRQEVNISRLCEIIAADIDDFKPDMIGLSALTDDIPLGIPILRRIRPIFPKIPMIVGGVHATVDPGGMIKEDCIDVVCVGEGEGTILDVANAVDKRQPLDHIQNLWVKKEDGSVIKNGLRPFIVDMDTLPFPDWSIYPQTAFYKPYHGRVYKYGDFEMSRGCPYKCSYCINVGLQELYKVQDNPNSYHREKSLPRVMKEIRLAMDTYGIEFLKFWDETFLLMNPKRLEEFGELYSKEIGLPYVIETTAASINARTAYILKKTNCRSASLGMETGSADLRKGILMKPTENQVYIDAFKLMKENGLRPVSFNMLGLPYESKEDLFRTVMLNRLGGTESQSVGIFYPYKGTPIRNYIQSKGLMDEDYEYTTLKQENFTTFTATLPSVIKNASVTKEELLSYKELFPLYVHLPIRLWALIDHCKNERGPFVDYLLLNLRRVLFFVLFKEDPENHLSRLESIRHAVRITPAQVDELFSSPLALAFKAQEPDVYRILIAGWLGSEHVRRFSDLFEKIMTGRLRPEVVPPENLDEWLGLQSGEAQLRAIRKELIDIAKLEAQNFSAQRS